MENKSYSRVYYLDWLRVIGILAVFIFHSTRFFDLGNWHVKSPLMIFEANVFQEALMTWMMPFYILHQTVLLCVGFFVVQWAIPAAQMWLIIAPVSFAIIMLLYEYLVRRYNTLRILFGMKPQARVSTVPAAEPALAGGKIQ